MLSWFIKSQGSIYSNCNEEKCEQGRSCKSIYRRNTYGTGIKAVYGYDSDKNITSLINKKADGSNIESFSYTYDYNGNQLTKTENGITTSYAYDKLNRLTKENKTTYTYDNAGNRLSKADGTDTLTYAYDQRNRLTQVTENGILTTYSYDNNGNLIAESDGTQYLYDSFNRQVETSNPDGTWQKNIYDATGLRMANVENGIYTEYIFDRGSVIADYDNHENRTTRYIRGYDLISQKDNEGSTSYYLHNAHGDVTKLVDITGNVKNIYSYDAFGNTTAYSEQVENRFRYAGEQYDTVTGQYYLRARYYEPIKGRFINEDTYGGQINNPLTLNLYIYCLNSPLKYTDPTGHNVDAALDWFKTMWWMIPADTASPAGDLIYIFGGLLILVGIVDAASSTTGDRSRELVLDNDNPPTPCPAPLPPQTQVTQKSESTSVSTNEKANTNSKCGKKEKANEKNKTDELSDADSKDLKKLPKNKVEELGGEDYTQKAKKDGGKSTSNLFWNPKTGDVYSCPNGSNIYQWIDKIPID